MTRKVYSLKQTTINFSQCLRQIRCGKCCIFLAEKIINQQIIPIHIFLLPAPRYSILLLTSACLGAFLLDGSVPKQLRDAAATRLSSVRI